MIHSREGVSIEIIHLSYPKGCQIHSREGVSIEICVCSNGKGYLWYTPAREWVLKCFKLQACRRLPGYTPAREWVLKWGASGWNVRNRIHSREGVSIEMFTVWSLSNEPRYTPAREWVLKSRWYPDQSTAEDTLPRGSEYWNIQGIFITLCLIHSREGVSIEIYVL